jgi:ABC-2 type transport system ATP-binding protein
MVDFPQIELARQIIKDSNKTVLLTKNKGTLMVHMNKREVPMLNKKLTDVGVQVYGIQIKEKTLEDKFLEVTEGEKWEN